MEDVYDRAPADSKLRKFLVDLLVWNDEELSLSDDSPHQMLRDMVQELKRKGLGKVKNPLLDIANYYTKEDELVPLEEKKVKG